MVGSSILGLPINSTLRLCFNLYPCVLGKYFSKRDELENRQSEKNKESKKITLLLAATCALRSDILSSKFLVPEHPSCFPGNISSFVTSI